ncbi:MAG: thermonuclease family protein [Lachnospiraceae bacterium]|nr:thermonuclease family protein [Lachnospiraceae bacterium]
MNKPLRLTAALLALCLLAGCAQTPSGPTGTTGTPAETSSSAAVPESTKETEKPETSAAAFEEHDYAGEIGLDMHSASAKQKVTVRNFVDGDTVHFNVPQSMIGDGELKARFLALNTPESTGKIEEYGKAASRFTREKLEKAAEILIESDDEHWNIDSTGGRYLVWVWYKETADGPWRNLNIEILQSGLAISNGTGQNRYASIAMAALNQARTLKLKIYSGKPDPDFYYGDAIELTLRELRLHTKDYESKKVAFEGNVIQVSGSTAYVEEFDPETGLYEGISIFFGYNLSGGGLEILTAGNRVRIVGSVQYYETGGTWQIADVKYREMRPDDPGNIQKLGDGVQPAYVLTDAKTFAEGTVRIQTEEGEEEEFPYAEFLIDTSLEMKGLKVLEVRTTTDPDSSQNGAMTLHCDCGGTAVTVRTKVLYDENKNLITADAFEGKTIDVKGLIGRYNGDCQIIVFSAENITISD